MNTGLKPSLRLPHRLHHRVGDVVVRVRPGVDDFVVALAVRDVARLVRALEALDARFGLAQQRLLLRRDVQVLDADRDAATRGVAEAEVLEPVEELRPSSARPACR